MPTLWGAIRIRADRRYDLVSEMHDLARPVRRIPCKDIVGERCFSVLRLTSPLTSSRLFNNRSLVENS
jgi:hypothetical protein